MPETVTTHEREATQHLAAEAAARLRGLPRDRAVVVTLRGDLGAGKTTFTQGLLGALGVEGVITSPTFLLVHRYPLTEGFANAYHVDAYRLKDPADFASLGIEEALTNPENLVIVEWPEVGGELFKANLDVLLEHGANENERMLTLTWQ